MNYRGIFTIILVLILFSSFCYAKESMDIAISLSKNDIVTETITLDITAKNSYDLVEFNTIAKPLTVIYDGEYSIREENSNYIASFEKDISPGKNLITFSLVYDNIIESSGKNKVFRTSFYPSEEPLTVSLTLPTYHVLSEKKPSTTPKPSFIESDGRKITLYWKFNAQEQADIAVFYKSQGFSLLPIIISIITICLISSALYVYFKRKTKANISETLSTEEIKVIQELRKGITKQKEIARNLEFSKSKMSKVIRKLEEKGLIEKKPFFKTNVIKLSPKIK